MSFHGNCFHDIYVPFVRPTDAANGRPNRVDYGHFSHYEEQLFGCRGPRRRRSGKKLRLPSSRADEPTAAFGFCKRSRSFVGVRTLIA